MTWLPDDFVLRALLAGIMIALVAAPLGCFIVWRRMAYFGATIAHSGLLGAALGIFLAINPTIGVVMVSLVVAALLLWLEQRTDLPSDTLMGFLAHTTLAAGLIIASTMEGQRFDLMGYLFGNIFSIEDHELLWIGGGGLLVFALIYRLWRPLLSISIHEELARAEGVSAERTKFIFIFLLAFTVAIAMKVIGILLIVSFLIMPPSIARSFSSTPENMLLWTAIVAALSVATGLALAYNLDTPGGPTIVIVMAAFLVLSQLKTIRMS